ncbi:hypothetical protein OS493_003291 [Desmophyllum pertusum]|uniref:Uncharacterized protein n=1 Tax=Desmophyllum pertusum TaxID=174260 RepID=A0A9X0A561_9CNID|nr:hypothetical protein OS493_003291 [Desmophyllum pertusum]
MPNTTWGALRFAEEFVRVKLSTLTSAQITIRPAQKSAGYILEATGNYLTLHSVQSELEKLETTCTSYIYDHTVSGATRFLFLDQNGPSDVVTFKKLKRDFAVNLNPLAVSLASMSIEDDVAETKFCSVLSSQLEVFKRQHLSYVHGTDTLKIKAEFGSIYVENAHALVSLAIVGTVEDTLSKNADPKNQSGQAKKQNLMRHKFIPLWSSGCWTAAFQLSSHESTEETYTLGIKAGKNHTMTVIYDEDLQFHDVEIPPINWVVVDVKAPRPARTKSRDIDFRVTVCSERKLDAEEKEEVMKSANYEIFKTKSIISKAPNGGLVLASEFLNKVAFVRHDKTSLYHVYRGKLFATSERSGQV